MSDPPTPEPTIPDPAPLIKSLFDVANAAFKRNSDQALKAWNQAADGKYGPKDAVRDATAFWGGATKDVAKSLVLVRDFFVKVAEENQETTAK
jgi:hypothetical protein